MSSLQPFVDHNLFSVFVNSAHCIMKLFIYINLRNLLDDWEICGTKTIEVALKEIFSLHFFFHMYIWEMIYFITVLMKMIIKDIHFRKRYCCAFETSTFHEVLV